MSRPGDCEPPECSGGIISPTTGACGVGSGREGGGDERQYHPVTKSMDGRVRVSEFRC